MNCRLTMGASLFGMLLLAPPVLAQCEGYPVPGTTETRKSVGYCKNLKGALTWTLRVVCYDRCNNPWYTLPDGYGSADAACTVIPPQYCSPEWYRYNYVNGMYAESSAWNMKIFGGCDTDYQTTVANNCPCAPSCGGGWDPPDPNPCSGTPPVEVESSTLTAGGAALPETPELGIFTARRETVDGVEFIREDWAIVRTPASGPAAGSWRVEASSSGAPAAVRRARWRDGRPGERDAPSVVTLVVERPAHPDNSRMIPMPEVTLAPRTVPFLGERVTGVVQVDVGEDRRIRAANLLYVEGSLPHGLDLAAEVRDHLRIRYRSEKRHRIMIYAVIDVERGRLQLRDSVVVLPLCCCNPICK